MNTSSVAVSSIVMVCTFEVVDKTNCESLSVIVIELVSLEGIIRVFPVVESIVTAVVGAVVVTESERDSRMLNVSSYTSVTKIESLSCRV